MIAALSIFMVRLITFFYGKLASHFFPRPPIQDHEIETYFFQKGGNFRATMARVRAVQVAMFGPSGLATFVKLNLLHYLFFVSALLVFLLVIPGFDEVISFVRRGFTLDLDANEHSYAVAQHFNNVSNEGLYIGDEVTRTSIMTLIFMATFSASGSVALLYNFRLIKTFAGRNFGLIATNARLVLAFLVSVACDLGAFVILLVAIALLGKVAGPRLDEFFQASLPEHYFEYGVSLEIGNPTQGTSNWGYGLREMDVDFSQYSELTKKVEKPRWPEMIFSGGPLWVNDASKICDQLGIDRDDCADRMRAMFLRHLDFRAEWIPNLARAMWANVGSLACGRNLWSGILPGPGANQAVRLGLPFFASLAALMLARALLIPWLIILSFTDRFVIALGRKASLQSIESYSELSTHGAVLLSVPPVVASVALLSLSARIFC